jgi:hypothetical protein
LIGRTSIGTSVWTDIVMAKLVGIDCLALYGATLYDYYIRSELMVLISKSSKGNLGEHKLNLIIQHARGTIKITGNNS